jgi:hypothetical protein
VDYQTRTHRSARAESLALPRKEGTMRKRKERLEPAGLGWGGKVQA